jgi:hypothetical protein
VDEAGEGDLNAFGLAMEAVRQRRGLSKEDFARELGTSRWTLWRRYRADAVPAIDATVREALRHLGFEVVNQAVGSLMEPDVVAFVPPGPDERGGVYVVEAKTYDRFAAEGRRTAYRLQQAGRAVMGQTAGDAATFYLPVLPRWSAEVRAFVRDTEAALIRQGASDEEVTLVAVVLQSPETAAAIRGERPELPGDDVVLPHLEARADAHTSWVARRVNARANAAGQPPTSERVTDAVAAANAAREAKLARDREAPGRSEAPADSPAPPAGGAAAARPRRRRAAE